MSTTEAIKKVFNEMKVGDRFRGYELKNRVVELRPESANMYIDTILRQLRRLYHGKYRMVGSYHQSLYEKIG